MKRIMLLRILPLILSLIFIIPAVPGIALEDTVRTPAPYVTVKADVGALKIEWKRAKKAKAYQVEYSRNKRFKKSKKIKLKGYETSCTINNLKELKRYYVRVRARYKINGKLRYGKWSKVKKKTTETSILTLDSLLFNAFKTEKNHEGGANEAQRESGEFGLPEEPENEEPVIPEGVDVYCFKSLYDAAKAVNGEYGDVIPSCDSVEAVCLMYSDGENSFIEMINDSEETEIITFNNSVSINLRKHTVIFESGKYITNNALDFSLSNGVINSCDSSYSVYSPSSNSESNVEINGITFNTDITDGHKSGCTVIDSSALKTEVRKVRINLNGEGNASYPYGGIILRGTSNQNASDIENVTVFISVNRASEIYGINDSCITQNNKRSRIKITSDAKFRGAANGILVSNVSYLQNVNIEKPYVTITADNTSTHFGIHDERKNKDGMVTITDAKANVVNAAGPARGIGIYGKNAEITGADIFAEETDNASDGVGIILNGYDGKNRYRQYVTVCETEEHPVNVYGKMGGIVLKNGTYNILGGTYTSVDHTGYLAGTTTVRDAVFRVANRELYTKAQLTATGNANEYADAYGLYFGCAQSSENTDIINMYNCVIGNDCSCGYGELDNMPTTALSAKCGYIQPKEVNLYDCDIYCGSRFVIRYVDAYKQTKYNMTAKFNLYGNTRVFNRTGAEYTKQEIRNAALTWRTSYFNAQKSATGSSDANNKYYIHNGVSGITKIVGYSYYAPTEDTDMNTQIRDSYGTLTGADAEQYLNDDAVNIHDYR